MHIYSNVMDLHDCADLASECGIKLYNAADLGVIKRGRRAGKRNMTLVLRPVDERHRAERNGRRLWAVDWEGHREFMARVFMSDHDAEIDSALARYRGVAEFERLYPRTSLDMNTGYRGKVMA